MSKQTGLITFTGKMGGISFYQKKGVHMARKASGPSREQILTSPRFQRTRENLSEFAALAVSAQSLKKMLAPVANFTDGNLRGRMVKVFRTMMKRSEGIRGKRPVLLSQNRELLHKLELTSSTSFESVYAARFNATHNASRTQASLSIANMTVANVITSPSIATHFRLVHFLGTLSDTVFNEETKKYEAADALSNSQNEVSFSDYLDVNASEAITITLDTALRNLSEVSSSTSVVQALGITFYEQIGTAYYALSQGRAMQIVDVF